MADGDVPRGGTGMQKKLGGIPVWGWIVGGTVLVAGVWFWYKNRSSSASSAANTSSTTNQSDIPAGLSTEQYESLLALLRDIQGNQGNETSPTGGSSGSTVGTGTATYPGGVPITTPPGSSAPIAGSGSAPATPPAATTPSAPKTVTVGAYPSWNSTLWGIAQQEYGSGADYPKIFAANQNLIVSNEQKHGMSAAQAQQRKWLYPGEVLTIP